MMRVSNYLIGLTLMLSLASAPTLRANCPGDLNCDDVVNLADVEPLVTALLAPAAYDAAYPSCDANFADLNNDGQRDGQDVAAFTALLLGGEASCEPVEIVLRDSITDDPAYTSWQGTYLIDDFGPSNRQGVVFEVQSAVSVQLTALRVVIVNSFTAPDDWSVTDFRIRAWTSEAEALASPLAGTIVDVLLDEPISTPVEFGGTNVGPFTRPTLDLTLDISPLGLSVPAAGSIFLGFAVNGGASDRVYSIAESDEFSKPNTDLAYSENNGWNYLSSLSQSIESGRAAVEVRGVAN